MSFNHELSKEDEDCLIKLVQKTRGCFNVDCGDSSAKKQCIKCRVAVYCSKECQVAAWPVHKMNCDKILRATGEL